ncbi:peptidase inhibitor 16 [Magallana gigas]|uniref:peptidase inhibitor 16 n=1 Tax=Magallana gigas TaxID=29159 RepID=UPI0033406BBD
MKSPCLMLLLALYVCSYASALTQFEQGFLDAHNAKRRIVNPSAANMKELKWSAELAIVAQNYANKCTTEHNPYRNQQASFQEVGENLYWNTAQVSPSTAVDSWDNEKNYYNYGSNTCSPSKFCGHYTQVVWAETEYVGCAVAFCNPLDGFTHPSAYHYVCNYGESGNTLGVKPYVSGTCQCPSGYSCNNNLCQ